MAKHEKEITYKADVPANEFYEARIKSLENELKFANETIVSLREQVGRCGKWANEIEANADDRITELEAENAKLRGKIVKLVESYV